jgi:hypothetical protein
VEEDSDEDEGLRTAEVGGAAALETARKAPTAGVDLHEAAAAKAAAAIRVQHAAASAKLPPAPKSGTELERACKSMSSDPARLAAYVRQLSPADLPGVFKSSLSASSIVFVARAVAKGGMLPDDAAFASELLTGVTKCDRFGITAMLLSRSDKAVVKEAIDGLQSAGVDVASLRTLFKA